MKKILILSLESRKNRPIYLKELESFSGIDYKKFRKRSLDSIQPIQPMQNFGSQGVSTLLSLLNIYFGVKSLYR